MKKGRTMNLLVITLFVISIASIVLADPVGPEASGVSSSRRTTVSNYQTSALAGNVTSMNLDVISITSYWQGYYGNITGTVVLANSNNDSMYDWSAASPTGQVYASTASTVTWGSIACASQAQINSEASTLNMLATASDHINSTFSNGTTHNGFYVGATQITAGNCFAASLHNATSQNEDNLFTDVLLYDGSAMVYTSLINNDKTGFDNKTHDFQLIVGEDGRTDSAATTYYFWVELR